MNAFQEQAGSSAPQNPQVPPPPAAGSMPNATWGGPPPATYSGHWAHGRKSPFVAGLLSFMPGLGQVYLGYYQRGFLHAVIFVTLVAGIIADFPTVPLALSLAFFVLYNIIDAARRASLYNQALAGANPPPLPEDFKMPSGRSSLLAGVLVTSIGLIFLMHTRFDFDLEWLHDWWPLVIVIVGANMVWKTVRERKS